MNVPNNQNLVPVLISLGSNIQPAKNIKGAIELLSEKFYPITHSSIWESPAVGSSGPNYLNSAALFHTDLSPLQVKIQILAPIENKLGRTRSHDKYADRTIDLDTLVYNDIVFDPELWEMVHLALPASEICPELYHPDSGKSLQEIAQILQKRSTIFQYEELTE